MGGQHGQRRRRADCPAAERARRCGPRWSSCLLRRRPHAGGALLADADGKDGSRPRRLARAGCPIFRSRRPDHGRGEREFRDVGRRHHRRTAALIGFAGPRVIEQTIGGKLPDGFQRSEFLLAHGLIDLVTERRSSGKPSPASWNSSPINVSPGRREALIRPGCVAYRVACAAGTSPPPRALFAALPGRIRTLPADSGQHVHGSRCTGGCRRVCRPSLRWGSLRTGRSSVDGEGRRPRRVQMQGGQRTGD